MVKFSEYGKMEYCTRYKIDKEANVIAEYDALISNISDKFTNVHIHATRYVDDRGVNYETTAHFTDPNGIRTRLEFGSSVVMRLDAYMRHIERLYAIKIQKHNPVFDYVEHTWYNSTIKTENEYKVKIGEVMLGDTKQDLFIDVPKDRAVVVYGTDVSIKGVEYDPETETVTIDNDVYERFVVTDSGMIHYIHNTIIQDYVAGDQLHHIEFCDYEFPNNCILVNMVPEFYLPTQSIKLTEGEDVTTIVVDYDNFGLVRHYGRPHKEGEKKIYHVHEEFFDTDNTLYEANSLHTVFIDMNNARVSYAHDLIAFDHIQYIDEDNSKFAEFYRHVRSLNDNDRTKLSDTIDNYDMYADSSLALYVEDFDNIISRFITQ